MSLPKILPALAIILTSLTFIATDSPSNTCYWPDGTIAPNRVPCESIPGDATWCCEASSVCTTGGYCVGNAGVFSRGGCTDQTWKSNFCPQLCAQAVTNNFANFYPCNPGVFSTDNWVCGDPSKPDVNFCDTPSFTFEPGSPFEPQGQAAAVMSTMTSTVTVTSSVTAQPSFSAAASAIPKVNICPPHNNALLGVGLGLGIGLGLLAIAALLGFVVERRKRKSAEKNFTQAQMSHFRQGDRKGYDRSQLENEAGSQTLHEIGHSHRSS